MDWRNMQMLTGMPSSHGVVTLRNSFWAQAQHDGVAEEQALVLARQLHAADPVTAAASTLVRVGVETDFESALARITAHEAKKAQAD